MTDDRMHDRLNDPLDKLLGADDALPGALRDAAARYNRLGEPPREAMWSAIAPAVETELTRGVHAGRGAGGARSARGAAWIPWGAAVAAMAASLVLGIGIGGRMERGRATAIAARATAATTIAARSVSAASAPTPADPRYDIVTLRHLGRTEAFLLAFRASEGAAGGATARSAADARELLTTTRLLLDSPATRDVRLHALFEDLELVLAQIAQLSAERHAGERELVDQALTDRDVLPRLRTVVPTDPVAAGT